MVSSFPDVAQHGWNGVVTSLIGCRTKTVIRPVRQTHLFVTIPQVAGKAFGSKAICDLTLYQGRVYVGYGDYGANNGPTDVVSFDPQTKEITTHLKDVPTEAIYPYREFDGWLYGPYVDPRWYYGPGGYVTNQGGEWHTVEVPDMVHTFDVHVDSRGTFVCGSRLDEKNSDFGHAVVMFRPAGDAAWQRVLQSDDMGGFTRFYSFTVVGEELRVAYIDTANKMVVYSTTDGVAWKQAPAVPQDSTSTPLTRSIIHDGWEYMGSDQGTIERRLLADPPVM